MFTGKHGDSQFKEYKDENKLVYTGTCNLVYWL